MRIFKTKWFARFARKSRISDSDLCEVIDRAERGLIDADVGGDVIKMRIARPNQGKSGGFRSIIYFRAKEKAFFVFGFAKSDLDNISQDDEDDYRRAAQVTLNFDDEMLEHLIYVGELIEVKCDEKEVQE